MFDLHQLLDWTEYTKLLIGLLAMVDPFSTIPIFLGLTSDRTPAERQRIALVAAGVAAATLLVFTFLGKALLSLFGITIEAFQIAGGILLLLMALEMMGALPGATTSDESDSSGQASIGIVPLAIPLLAGPAAMSTILIYAHRHESLAHDLLVSGVIISVMTIAFLMLRLSTVIETKLGKTGINVLNRIMGLIVAAIAVEFIIDGLAAHFPALVR